MAGHATQLGSILDDQRLSSLVWGRLPHFLEVQPPLEASDFGFVWHELAKPVPRLVTINIDKAAKLLVLKAG